MQNLAHGLSLTLRALADNADAQLGGPQIHDVRVASGNYAEASAGPLPQPDTQSIANVELFDLDPFVIEDDAAVGKDTIDVDEKQLDRLALLIHGHVRTRA